MSSEADKASKALERTVRELARHNLERDIETSIRTFGEQERERMTGPAFALASMSAEDFERVMPIIRHARKIADRAERRAYVMRQCEAHVTDYVSRLASSAASRSRPCGSCSRLTETATCGACFRKP